MFLDFSSIERNHAFVRSVVAHTDGTPAVDNNLRSSTTAYLRRRQTAVVQCIEPLQVVKYESHQQVCDAFLRLSTYIFLSLVQTAC